MFCVVRKKEPNINLAFKILIFKQNFFGRDKRNNKKLQ